MMLTMWSGPVGQAGIEEVYHEGLAIWNHVDVWC
jgi:hypothetical protein